MCITNKSNNAVNVRVVMSKYKREIEIQATRRVYTSNMNVTMCVTNKIVPILSGLA